MAKKAAPKAAEAKASAPAPKAAPAPAATASAAADKSARPKAATKGEVYTAIAEKTNLAKKDIAAVFEAMGELIKKELTNKKGAGQFVIPGLLKIKVIRKPATKAKQGINPFTKEPMTIKAKPARNALKALFLKGMKEMV